MSENVDMKNLGQNNGFRQLFAGEFGEQCRQMCQKLHMKEFDQSNYDIETVHGGYLNCIYRLFSRDDPAKSVIVKHAPPYIKCLGIEQPLGSRRVHVEYQAMKEYHRASPGAVPEMYFYNDGLKCVVMEDLRDFQALDMQLPEGILDLDLARNLAKLVAKLHRNTHIQTTPREEIEMMLATFSNEEMVSLNANMAFTIMVNPNHPANRCSPELTEHARSIRQDRVILKHIQELHRVFLERKDCLVHGDLHFGSVMVNGSSAKLIDAEFAFMGPAAIDISLILAYYLFFYAAHLLYPKDSKSHFSRLVQQAIKDTVNVYFDDAKEYLNEEALATLVSHTAGFTGCYILKWMIGLAEERNLLDKPKAELMSLNIGVSLLKDYSTIKAPGDLLRYFFES